MSAESERVVQLEKAVGALLVVFARALAQESKPLRDRMEAAGAAEFQRLQQEGDHDAAALLYPLLRELHDQNLKGKP